MKSTRTVMPSLIPSQSLTVISQPVSYSDQLSLRGLVTAGFGRPGESVRCHNGHFSIWDEFEKCSKYLANYQ